MFAPGDGDGRHLGGAAGGVPVPARRVRCHARARPWYALVELDGAFTLNPGDIVAGKYQIIAPLGVGGSGAVYRAQKVGMKLQVALKMMHAEHPDGDNERARFAREAELVKRLQHPHIVRLMDYGHAEDGVPYLAFALLTGQPLEDKIKNEGPLDHNTIGRFSQQVLRALDRAHSLNVVHRDLKPANIFLSSGVLGEVVQMLDFGLAKMVHDAPGAMDVTRVGSVMGTPRYMAPEQVRGEQVGPTADIYSFGLVMAEMLLGRPLVEGKKEIEIYVAQGSDREHVLPALITQSPFAAIVKRAVAKPLNVRYRQASQMLADVNAVVEALSGGQQVMSEA
ncbi:MAG TPA: serine/threonine protein kinase, partial [Sorangium sp.]|nr:serine/threonine protein kinase [Sorangium sp.]